MKKGLLFLAILLNLANSNGQDLQIDVALKIGSIKSEVVEKSILDKDGNIYLTGYFEGTVDFDPGNNVLNLTSNGGLDAFIVKLNPNGELIWARGFGGPKDDGSKSLLIDNQNNVYLTGTFEDSVDFNSNSNDAKVKSNGGYDVFTLKLDYNGDFKWVQSYGGPADDFARDLVINSKDKITLTGTFYGTVDFDPSTNNYFLTSTEYDIYLNSIDTSGSFISALKIGGSGYDYSKYIAIDDSDNIYLSGTFEETVDFDHGSNVFNFSSLGGNDIFILKLNSSFDFIWVKSFGSSSAEDVRFISINQNSLFVSMWSLGQFDLDPGNGVMNYNPIGGTDIIVSKLNLNGTLEWAKVIGGIGEELCDGIIIDSKSNLYLTGYFTNKLAISKNQDSILLTSKGLRDILLIKMDASANVIWAVGLGSSFTDFGSELLINSSDEIILTGAFSDLVDFDPSSNSKTLQSSGVIDVFLVKFKDNTTSLNPLSFSTLKVYPNPSNGLFEIINLNNSVSVVDVYDLNGNLVYSLKYNEFDTIADLRFLENSIYIIKVTCKDNSTHFTKWVKSN